MNLKKLLLTGLCLGVLGSQLQASIIQGFEGGTIAPGSAGAGYTAPGACVAGAPNELQGEATYAVTSNANDCHGSWHVVSAQEGSLFLAVNGRTTVGPVYEQTVGGLTIGNTYSLYAWFSGLFTSNPADVTWNITGGGTAPANNHLTNTTGDWEQNGITFVATGASLTFNIAINTDASSGNDFGIDNINLDDLGNQNPVPEPGTVGLLGMGAAILLGFGRRAKRKN